MRPCSNEAKAGMNRTQIALLLLLLPTALPTTSSSITGVPRRIERISSWLFSPRQLLDASPYLPVRRPHQPWSYRSSAAASSVQLTRTHALVAAVSHNVIPGVTTDMLLWWFTNVEGSATYPGDGQQWPKYLMWHPRDHIYQTTLQNPIDSPAASAAATPSPAAAAAAAAPLWEICEFFQCSNPAGYTAYSYPGPHATQHELLIKAVTVLKQLDKRGLWLTVPSSTGLGETLWNLRHSWVDTPGGGGVLVNSTQVVGVVEPAWRPLWFARGRNAIIRGLFGQGREPQQILAMWVQHCIEEMGNLEHILPRLYAEAHASSSGSRDSSISSSSKALGTGPASDSAGGSAEEDVHPTDQPSGAAHDRDGVKQSAHHDEL